MKKILLFSFVCFIAFGVSAQEFNKQLATAKASYTSGKLDDSRFAMQQMLQELDILTGKEIIKILPAKMQEQTANTAKDEVAGASNYLGITIHRDYGTEDKKIDLEIITHSPLIGSVNALLSLPFVAGSADYKVIKIEGYKALIQKVSGQNETTDYELQLPLNNSMITLKAPGYTQDQIVKMASTLPVAQIAKMVQ
jgi:hypothetical protein